MKCTEKIEGEKCWGINPDDFIQKNKENFESNTCKHSSPY